MSVNHEIKSHLAKLLATEDLVVEHRKVETAQFNVHTRVLTLPKWEKASSFVYDMLVGHEVGHALYTPDRDWLKEKNIPPQFVNVVEDVRIEKLMKRRYAGISKTFYRGYQELSEEDFFQIADEDLNSMNLADKVNLYFKIGSFVSIPFNSVEKELCNKISNAETFDDVLNLAEELYKFCKAHQEQTNNENTSMEENGSSSDSASSFSDSSEVDSSELSSDSSDSEVSDSTTGQSKESQQNLNLGGEHNEDLDVKTMDSLEQAIKDLASMDGHENIYLEVPKLSLDQVIISNKQIHDNCDLQWIEHSDRFDIVDGLYEKFKKSAQKEVSYLVKEFECRKSADSYARAITSRTGVLDTTKLHTYQYNEDLFKKVTTIPDGKNHGLIFILDWSGSMGQVMMDTLKQLYNLMMFCKKVSIPFDVYAFTNEYPKAKFDENNRLIEHEEMYQKKEGSLHIGEWFSMMHLFTHKVKSAQLDKQMLNIWRIAHTFASYAQYPVPIGMGLSGTPLNEALVSLHQIIPQFKKDTKVQKVQCVVLTDGEAGYLNYHREIRRFFENEDSAPYMGTARMNPACILRDRKTGNTYSLDTEWHGFTDVLLKNLRHNFKDVNFIGIRVLEPRDAKSFIRRYCGWYGPEYDAVESSWRKTRSFSIKKSGYHSYFGLSANSLSQSAEFDVSEDATKAQIKRAFTKSLSTKKMNKKILNEFVELIA